MNRTTYITDLRDEEWECIAPLLPAPLHMGVPGFTAFVKSSMPSSTSYAVGALGVCFPTICLLGKPCITPFDWRRNGLWERIHTALREQVREKMGRDAQPSAGIIDSQSVKTIGLRGSLGYDAGKKIKGRKRQRHGAHARVRPQS
jgi:putative transposase